MELAHFYYLPFNKYNILYGSYFGELPILNMGLDVYGQLHLFILGVIQRFWIICASFWFIFSLHILWHKVSLQLNSGTKINNGSTMIVKTKKENLRYFKFMWQLRDLFVFKF